MARRKLIPVNGWTPTEKRIIDLLSDGLPHTRDEVFKCLWDDQSNLDAIKGHLSRMRDKAPHLDIVCTLHHRRICYRLVRRLRDE